MTFQSDYDRAGLQGRCDSEIFVTATPEVRAWRAAKRAVRTSSRRVLEHQKAENQERDIRIK